ncbi:4'-phosphopantetheinyl transferase family protein [Clavibacter michiganensis]|uniref:4'-phosphopantetheinyl transferase family protein n=1 Tax=Clavibacter michiganensis TaxID=28447 RepID=UPI00142E0699|nr:4-phosphopantetheinyl transferase [Clavibacter michiganensis]MDO4098819.1 4-phosphopantetheinyl transferase [Clavibacter michiganensis]MDO4127885.1 4-phosphopantetheinyl transferase [Clavibacter michiganensis]NIY59506.1 4-phosphopantetheinyl transferase [Clavibacter michiganensis subsp. michiganensis]QXP04287.1 4-phosphopantetheinyl transferase [Clavibacter michiganensis subsp. michiganensis]QXP07322.1 4-phosphopantetheinyl transferase [Clavibacter michiganensis subsp. michiganensis]
MPAPAVVHVAVVRGPETAARAARTAAGRAALRALAAELVGADPADVTVRARCETCGGAHGRPVLGGSRALDGLHASVAHAGGLVVVAVSPDGPIGIDAEPRGREAPPGTTLAEWVRVEAVLKTDGRGLLVDPSLVRVEGDATGMTAWIEGEPARYRLVDVDLGSGLVVAIARRGLGELDARIQDPAGPGSDI